LRLIERATSWHSLNGNSLDEAYRLVLFVRRNMPLERPNGSEYAAERESEAAPVGLRGRW
jgi:hypothetical protein